MAEPIQLTDIIAPLVPPPAPPPYGWIALGVGLALLVILIVARLWWRRNRDKRAALAQVKQAERALQQQQLDPRAAVFHAAQALRRAYKINRPSIQFPLPSPLPHPSPWEGEGVSSVDTAWTDFLSALDQARYAAQAPSVQDAAQLLAQARHWIGRAAC